MICQMIIVALAVDSAALSCFDHVVPLQCDCCTTSALWHWAE